MGTRGRDVGCEVEGEGEGGPGEHAVGGHPFADAVAVAGLGLGLGLLCHLPRCVRVCICVYMMRRIFRAPMFMLGLPSLDLGLPSPQDVLRVPAHVQDLGHGLSLPYGGYEVAFPVVDVGDEVVFPVREGFERVAVAAAGQADVEDVVVFTLFWACGGGGVEEGGDESCCGRVCDADGVGVGVERDFVGGCGWGSDSLCWRFFLVLLWIGLFSEEGGGVVRVCGRGLCWLCLYCGCGCGIFGFRWWEG